MQFASDESNFVIITGPNMVRNLVEFWLYFLVYVACELHFYAINFNCEHLTVAEIWIQILHVNHVNITRTVVRVMLTWLAYESEVQIINIANNNFDTIHYSHFERMFLESIAEYKRYYNILHELIKWKLSLLCDELITNTWWILILRSSIFTFISWDASCNRRGSHRSVGRWLNWDTAKNLFLV